jgi:hypothetical protein
MSPRSALLLLVALAPVGCAAPLLHGLRAAPGGWVDVSMGMTYSAERLNGCAGEAGCEVPGMAAGGNPLQVGAGYAWVFEDHIGLILGAQFPAWANQKLYTWWSGLSLTSFATVQTENLSFGVGPEIGLGGVALVVGAEGLPWGPRSWLPGLGVWSRYFWPYEPDRVEINGRAESWEVGARLRFGAFVLQYAYHHQQDGWMSTSRPDYGRGMHLVSVGLQLDADTFELDWSWFDLSGNMPLFLF